MLACLASTIPQGENSALTSGRLVRNLTLLTKGVFRLRRFSGFSTTLAGLWGGLELAAFTIFARRIPLTKDHKREIRCSDDLSICKCTTFGISKGFDQCVEKLLMWACEHLPCHDDGYNSIMKKQSFIYVADSHLRIPCHKILPSVSEV